MGNRVPLARSGERPFRESWPFLLVILAVLVPTGVVMWLMSDAVSKQVAESRESMNEAYRSQLQLLRPRVDDVSKVAAAGLQLKGTAIAAMRSRQEHFESLVRNGGVDGVVLFNSQGHAAFPTLNTDNRVALADIRLFNLQQMSRDNTAGRATLAGMLAAMLNDFTEPMPAGQRLFLMDEVKRIQPDAELPVDPFFGCRSAPSKLASLLEMARGSGTRRSQTLGRCPPRGKVCWVCTRPTG